MMLLGLLAIASATPGLRSHTAQTLPAKQGVVRAPTGVSGVGLTDHDELWIIPFDIGIGGPRVGVEHGWTSGPWQLSVRPSMGVKHTVRRGSLRLEPLVSWSTGAHSFTLELAVDARFIRQLQIDDDVTHELSFDRLQSHALLVWDHPHLRAKLRLPLMDRDHVLRWGSGSLAWVHETDRVLVAAGVGLLVGRPVDQYTLDTYHWWFWQPFPEVDFAYRF